MVCFLVLMHELEYWKSFLSVPAPSRPHLAFGKTCMRVRQGCLSPHSSSPSVVDWCFWLLCERFVLWGGAVGVLSSPTPPSGRHSTCESHRWGSHSVPTPSPWLQCLSYICWVFWMEERFQPLFSC